MEGQGRRFLSAGGADDASVRKTLPYPRIHEPVSNIVMRRLQPEQEYPKSNISQIEVSKPLCFPVFQKMDSLIFGHDFNLGHFWTQNDVLGTRIPENIDLGHEWALLDIFGHEIYEQILSFQAAHIFGYFWTRYDQLCLSNVKQP